MRRLVYLLLTIGLSTLIAACGGGGGGGSHDSNSGGGGGSVSTPTGSNVQPISVNSGPVGAPNIAYTNVTVCIPGTSQCQTINNVLIDTGSMGLRLLPSALGSLTLPPQLAANNNPLYDCVQFVDLTHTWGPVRLADIRIAGLQANSTQIQIIGGSGTNPEPTNCGGGDSSLNLDTVDTLFGNGILGVGNFRTDCGLDCVSDINLTQYYSCSANNCTPALVDTSIQVQNPVMKFPTDNNGVIIQLPSVSSKGATSVEGSMIFGINTRTNNALGSAKLFTAFVDNNNAYVNTNYKGLDLDGSYIDSGSNIFYFRDDSITQCPDGSGFYCPLSGNLPTTINLTASINGENDNGTTISFSVANPNLLNSNAYAFNNLAAYTEGFYFDWGLPFFFGRSVYTVFENSTNPAGPSVAF